MLSKAVNHKPSNLIYGVNDTPPLLAMVLLALQQVFILAVYLVYPVLVVRAVGGDPVIAQSFVSLSMIAIGVGTILQALKKGPVGSGYLCPEASISVAVPVSIMAFKSGGYSLMLGMTLVAGIFEVLLSPLMRRLRVLFPSEVTGAIVFMIGVTIIPLGISNFFSVSSDNMVPDFMGFIVGIIPLTIMIIFNVWGRGMLRQCSVLIGIIVGYILAAFSGLFSIEQLTIVAKMPFIALPNTGYVGWSFDWSMITPIVIVTLASAIGTVGNLTTCQKSNNTEWIRPDMNSIRGGLMAEGLGNIFSGLIGGYLQGSSSSSVGLSIATGATSRRIAYFIGGILIILGFLPKLAAVLVIIPRPVIGAALIFNACFIIITSFQIITSRMLDARKIFTIGLPLIFGLSVDMLPKLYTAFPLVLQPFMRPSICLVTITIILLNMLFRIGIAKRKTLEFDPEVDGYEKIFSFMETEGAVWGARREVIYRVISALNEFMESASAFNITKGKVMVTVSFDEYNLDVKLSYEGNLMEFSKTRPTNEELLDNDDEIAKLSGFMIRQYADKVRSWVKEERCYVEFHFEH